MTFNLLMQQVLVQTTHHHTTTCSFINKRNQLHERLQQQRDHHGNIRQCQYEYDRPALSCFPKQGGLDLYLLKTISLFKMPHFHRLQNESTIQYIAIKDCRSNRKDILLLQRKSEVVEWEAIEKSGVLQGEQGKEQGVLQGEQGKEKGVLQGEQGKEKGI
jgi:hypothetical protein